MEMVGHQAVAKRLDGMTDSYCAEQIENGGIVAVLVKDGGGVATVQHVIGMAGAVMVGMRHSP